MCIIKGGSKNILFKDASGLGSATYTYRIFSSTLTYYILVW